MSVDDPILEALTFTLQNDLNVLTPPAPTSAGSTTPSCSGHCQTEKCRKSSESNSDMQVPTTCEVSMDFIRSSVLLGEEEPTLCPFNDCSYSTSENICADKKRQGEFLAHLLNEHKLVVENSDEIATLNLYLKYWRGRFSTTPLTEFCVGFLMEELPKPPEVKKKRKKKLGEESGNEVNEEEEEEEIKSNESDRMYFMLSPALPEDMKLRKELWKRRLDIVLEVNRQEREDNSFCRRCLFCRDVITGNRSEYFIHMRENHSFHIGQPDNLVFVKEFLQFIEDKLNRLECLFCEHIFKDKTVLKEHMRKKQHRKINPKNHDYDKFYVVNYLEPGKTWETLEQEDPEDERKEDEWIEPAEEKEKNIVCLFCKESNSDFDKILEHMKSCHSFNFASVTSSFDFYQKVKLVNYIRRLIYQNNCLCCEKHFEKPELLLRHIREHSVIDSLEKLPEIDQWNRPEYFFPTYEDDDFLTCLDNEDESNDTGRENSISSEDEGNVIPEDMPNLDMRNRDFDLAGFAIRYHNQSCD